MSTFRGGKPWEEKKGKKLQLFTAGEKASLVLCLTMLIFALQSKDVPLCFLIFAFFCYELQNVLAKIAGQRFRFLVSLLWGLCISLFVGSILMAFF